MDFINTHSTSFKYDLNHFFTFEKIEITNFLIHGLPDILNKDDEIKNKIKNYSELKTFLGNKRKKKIEKEDIIKNSKHFKNAESIKNIDADNISIDLLKNENIILENLKEHSQSITIFKKPIILTQIFESQSINVDLLNDNLSYNKRINDLNKYHYKIYSINNKDEKLNISEQIKLSKIKTIEIENENIYTYLFVMKSKLQEISDNDLLFDNIYPENTNENELISPNHNSKIYFYYFRIDSELQKKYIYIERE